MSKTLALMAAAPTQEEQMHYAYVLRTAKFGWASEPRRAYFSWFNPALRDFKGGNSFGKYLINIRQDSLTLLGQKERAEMASIIENRSATAAPAGPQRAFMKELSQMPEGLLNTLSKDEILDLLSYLEADGKPEATVIAGVK